MRYRRFSESIFSPLDCLHTVASAATRLARRLPFPFVVDFNSECKRRDRRKRRLQAVLVGNISGYYGAFLSYLFSFSPSQPIGFS